MASGYAYTITERVHHLPHEYISSKDVLASSSSHSNDSSLPIRLSKDHTQREYKHGLDGVKLLGLNLQQFPLLVQFLLCVAAVFFFHLIYAILQEYIFKHEKFSYGWFLTLVQFAIYGSLAFLDREIKGEHRIRRAPFASYLTLALCNVSTIGLANSSCVYLNYPTQVLFKSSKVIPVMIGGIFILRRSYSLLEYIAACCLVSGLAFTTLADSHVDPTFDWRGIILMFGSLTADAFVGNVQEKTMKEHRANQQEVVFYSSLVGCVYLTLLAGITGELGPAIRTLISRPQLIGAMTAFAFVGYFGVTAVLALIAVFDAVVAITVTSMRKVCSIYLSFVLFPKPFSWNYVIGACLVFVGIALNVYTRNTRQVQLLLANCQGFSRKRRRRSSFENETGKGLYHIV